MHSSFSASDPIDRTRSRNMSAVKSKDTSPEIAVRRVAHKLGFRFRLHNKCLPGKPDLVFPKWNLVIFVHGCFWHRHQGCSKASTPKTRVDFWTAKFNENVSRDERQVLELQRLGWRVATIWECQTYDKVLLERIILSIIKQV